MKYKYFIFDLDGTLIDTDEAILKTWQRTLQDYVYDFPLEKLKVVFGITQDLAFQKLNVTADDDFLAKWQNYYPSYGQKASFFADAVNTLRELKKHGCVLGVVTSRYRVECEKYFSHLSLSEYFDTVICADDTVLHKPAAEPLLKYMSVTGAKPSECVYVGDMPTDIECATAARVDSCLIARENSRKTTATYVFSSLFDVLTLL